MLRKDDPGPGPRNPVSPRLQTNAFSRTLTYACFPTIVHIEVYCTYVYRKSELLIPLPTTVRSSKMLRLTTSIPSPSELYSSPTGENVAMEINPPPVMENKCFGKSYKQPSRNASPGGCFWCGHRKRCRRSRYAASTTLTGTRT
jgi:hypothetical protein